MFWNLPTIIVLVVIGIALVAAVVFLIKNRGNRCSSCNGDCASCGRKKSN